jgi:hypothetical protein
MSNEFAQELPPFPDLIGHDYYIGLCASLIDELDPVEKPLDYWILHESQTSNPSIGDITDRVLQGIKTGFQSNPKTVQSNRAKEIQKVYKKYEERINKKTKEQIEDCIQSYVEFWHNRQIIYNSSTLDGLIAFKHNLASGGYERYSNDASSLLKMKDVLACFI